jgi:hypothetical protein
VPCRAAARPGSSDCRAAARPGSSDCRAAARSANLELDGWRIEVGLSKSSSSSSGGGGALGRRRGRRGSTTATEKGPHARQSVRMRKEQRTQPATRGSLLHPQEKGRRGEVGVNSDRVWDWDFAGVYFFALSPDFLSRGSNRGTTGVAQKPL